jgi:sulfoxide reductase heme-binding subunit YedZ
VLMIPLALTSTAGSIRRLGGKNWQRLHRLIYLTAILGVVHYLWLVKADKHKPLEYGAVLALLLLYRVLTWASEKREQSIASAASRNSAQPTKA